MIDIRKLVLPAMLGAMFCAPLAAQCASSFSFSGSWSQKLKSSDGMPYTVDTTSSKIKATLPMDVFMINASSAVTITFEPIVSNNPDSSTPEIMEIDFSLADDPNWTSGKTSASIVHHDDGTPDKPSGWTTTAKLNWTYTSLTIDVTSDDVLGGVSEAFLSNPDTGTTRFSGSYNMTVSFGDYATYSHIVDLTGSNTGSGNPDQGTVVNSGSFIASADFTPPTVAITSPTNGLKTSTFPLAFTGTANSKNGIQNVQYTYADYNWQSAASNSPTSWSFSITDPMPGVNTVLVKATDAKGNEATATNQFVFVITNQLSLQIVTIPSTATNLGAVSGLGDGQPVVAGQVYTVSATPNKAANAIFLYWSDGFGQTIGTNKTLKWLNPGAHEGERVTLQAHFAVDPYVNLKGTYAGLFYGNSMTSDSGDPISNSVNPTNAGTFNLTVTATGGFSGKIATLTGMYPFSGQFNYYSDDLGSAPYLFGSCYLSKANRYIEIRLSLVGGIPTLTGGVDYFSETDQESAPIRAQMVPAAVKTSPWAGSYTLGLGEFTDANQPDLPCGMGYGSATVTKTGSAAMVLNFPDKITAVSVSAGFLSTNYPTIPFFVPLYGNKGFAIGWADFSSSTNDSRDRTINSQSIVWYKPSGLSKQVTYANGFLSSGPLYGLCYEKTNLPATAHGSITIQGNPDSTLNDPITANWTYTAAKGFAFTNVSDNAKQLKLTLNTTTGIATGSVAVTPTSGPKVTLQFNGAVLTHASGTPEFYGFSVVGNSSVNIEMTLSE